jgi:MYXO-CTERM domain-containing protein
MTIEGDVVAVHSYWTDDGSRIETDATVHTVDGREVVVNQLGGTVDGIGMIQMPGERILELGMHVAIAAHTGLDLSRREHVVLDSAKIMSEAPGFVRTGPTTSGHYLYWPGTSTEVVLDSDGTNAIDMAQTIAIVDASIEEWNEKTASCSYFKVVNAGTRKLEADGQDKINVIKFHDQDCMCDPSVGTTSWGCRPATMKSPAKCYARAAAGITTATYVNDANSSRDGQIVDADIELNNVDFTISANGVSKTPKQPCLADLQNTLTHELGHLHGLEHTCLAPGDPDRIDNHGNPVPSCSAVQASPSTPANMQILAATMYNYQSCGETSKSTLSDDDIQAICTVYDINKAPSGGCCSASRGADRPAGALLLAGVVGFLMRRRRK